MIWFVLGPSGVGKSHFGKYLAEIGKKRYRGFYE